MPTITINDIDEQIKTLERLQTDLKAYEEEPLLSNTSKQEVSEAIVKLKDDVEKVQTKKRLIQDHTNRSIYVKSYNDSIDELFESTKTQITIYQKSYDHFKQIKSRIQSVMDNKVRIYQYKPDEEQGKIIHDKNRFTTYCKKPYEDPVMKKLLEELHSFDTRYEALKPPTDQSPEGVSTWAEKAADLTVEHYDALLKNIIHREKILTGQLIVDQQGRESYQPPPVQAQAQAQAVVFDQISKFMSLLDTLERNDPTKLDDPSIVQHTFMVRDFLRQTYDPAPEALITALTTRVLSKEGQKQPETFDFLFQNFRSPMTGAQPPTIKTSQAKDFIPQALSKAAKLEEMGKHYAQWNSQPPTPNASTTQTPTQGRTPNTSIDSARSSGADTRSQGPTPNTSIDSTPSNATKPSEHDAVATHTLDSKSTAIKAIDEQIKTLQNLLDRLKKYENKPFLSDDFKKRVSDVQSLLSNDITGAENLKKSVMALNDNDDGEKQKQIELDCKRIQDKIATYQTILKKFVSINNDIAWIMGCKEHIDQYKQEDKRTIQAAQTALTTYCQKPYEDPVMKQLSEELASFDRRYEALKPPTDQSPKGVSTWAAKATDLTVKNYEQLLKNIIHREKILTGQLIVDQEGRESYQPLPVQAQARAQAQEVVFDQISKFMSLLDTLEYNNPAALHDPSIVQHACMVRDFLRQTYDPAPEALINALNDRVVTKAVQKGQAQRVRFDRLFNSFQSPMTATTGVQPPTIKESQANDFIPQALSKAAKLEESNASHQQLKNPPTTPTASKKSPYWQDYEATSAFIKKVQEELDRVKQSVNATEHATNPRIRALQGIVDHFTAINEQYATEITTIVQKNTERLNQSELDAARKTLHEKIAEGAGVIRKNAGAIADAGIFGSIKKFFQEAFRDWHFPWNKPGQSDDLSFMKGRSGSKTSKTVSDAFTELQQQKFKDTLEANRPVPPLASQPSTETTPESCKKNQP